ncbi:hypothetical protein [Virgibacillus sediminis]|uniref:YtkA-like domain-containing protein n=1 Tax=Virgibacillus sediminis TaxID=202260 RepID=A0ABV7A996_9BACI
MMRRIFVISIVSLTAVLAVTYIFIQEEPVTLAEEKSAYKQNGEFILRIKVEGAEPDIIVHQSLQYIGEEPVEIKHRTPLVSVSLFHRNHDYTGSFMSRKMEKGDIHHQDAVAITVDEKGKQNLYIQARFRADGDEMEIDHVEELMFN